MTAKEKAKLLFKMYNIIVIDEKAKQCALITVNEIINSNPHSNPFNTDVYLTMEFWIDVKKEIQKL